jgi:hypothetical protein
MRGVVLYIQRERWDVRVSSMHNDLVLLDGFYLTSSKNKEMMVLELLPL